MRRIRRKRAAWYSVYKVKGASHPGYGGVTRMRAVSMRAAATGGVVAMVAVGFAAPTTASSAALRRAPCEQVTASPSFAAARTWFCAAASADNAGYDLYRSTDAGHTWAGPFPIERDQSSTDGASVTGVFASPAYDHDHTLYVGAFPGPGYVSTDGGVTFKPLRAPTAVEEGYDALIGYPWVVQGNTTPFLDSLPDGSTRAELLAGGVEGSGGAIFDPALPRRVPPDVPGTGGADYYLMPPDYATTHDAVALTRVGLWSPWEQGLARAYSCVGGLVCETMAYEFAPTVSGADTTNIASAGSTYPSSRESYAVVVNGRTATRRWEGPAAAYRSTDYGHTWDEWPSVTKLLAPFGVDDEVFINASPDAPHRLFLHLTGPEYPRGTPAEQLYRSDNDGETWHRIGYAWAPSDSTTVVLRHVGRKLVLRVVTRHSTLPWNTWSADRGPTIVEPGGRLYLVGERDADYRSAYRREFLGLFCSSDYGVTWHTTC